MTPLWGLFVLPLFFYLQVLVSSPWGRNLYLSQASLDSNLPWRSLISWGLEGDWTELSSKTPLLLHCQEPEL